MKRFKILFLFMTMALLAVSQNDPCYYDEVIEALEQSPFDHEYLLEEADSIIEANIQVTSPLYAAISSNSTYVIPVVVHVLHNSNELENVGSNISDSQIDGAILKLNNDFKNTLGQGVDIDIEFCLAERDPNGNSTNGINRIDASTCNCDYATNGMVGLLENNSNEIELKALSNWSNTEYINIWTVSEINGNNGGLGIQGFATPPGAPDIIDGLVVLASSFTSNNSVTTHEMGHFFSLYHTFQGDQDGTGCPPESNTETNGDKCEDTPPHRRSASFSCALADTNQCYDIPNIDFVENFLDYSAETCQKEFTGDQRMRMRCSMMEIRYQLMYSIGCLAPCPGQTAAFSTETSFVLVGEEVEFIDNSTGNGAVKWYVNDVDETPSTTSTDFDWTFTSPGTYFICQEKIGSSCSDIACQEITVTDNICIDPPLNFENGNFESFTNSAPTETLGIAGTNFINFYVDNWNVLKYSPDFYQTDPNDMNYSNFVQLGAFLQSNDSEGIFACYDFEKDTEYLICLSVKAPDISSLHELQISLGNNFVKATDFVLSQNNPDVGTQLIYNEKNSGFQSWTQESFSFFADEDFNNIAFVNRSQNNAVDDGFIWIDNIQIIPVDNETGFTVSSDTEACLGELVNLVATGGTSYNWTPASSLTCSDCPNPSATPSETTTYTVEITYGESCPITVSREVKITINCGQCNAIPSFDSVIDTCNVTFNGVNTGDSGEFLWDFGDGTVASGDTVDHTYLWGGDFVVCLTIKCNDFANEFICDTISISKDCTSCTDIGNNNARQCAPDSLNNYMSNIEFTIPVGLEPCTENGLFVYSNDVNVLINSFEIVNLDSLNNQVEASFYLNTTDQTGFEADGTTIYISLCDSSGTVNCYSSDISATTCDFCQDTLTVSAICVDSLITDSTFYYAGSVEFDLPSVGITYVECEANSTEVGYSQIVDIIDEHVDVDFSINTKKDGDFNPSTELCFQSTSLDKTFCLSLIIDINPCSLPDSCVQEWDPKSAGTCHVLNDEYNFTFNMEDVELDTSLNLSVCPGGAYGIIDGGGSISFDSVEIDKGLLSFNSVISMPCDFDSTLTYNMQLYLCGPNGELVCLLFQIDFPGCTESCNDKRSIRPAVDEITFKIYPNPTNNILYVAVEENQEFQYTCQIFDSLNKEVMHENIRGQSEVDVSSLTNGIYFVTLTKESGEFVGVKKLLIIN